jgi:hypothetical protein
VDDVLAVDGDPVVADLHAVTVIHALALVHGVVLASMLMQVFLLLWAVLLLAPMLLPLPLSMLLLAPRVLLHVFMLLSALLLLASLHHDVAEMPGCCFIRHARKVFPSRRETFYFPPCRKSLPVPGLGLFTFPHVRKVFRSLD